MQSFLCRQKYIIKKGTRRKRFSKYTIRIEVNDELRNETVLDAMDMLAVGGRLCVISFQSLEDRIVKEAFHERSTPKKVDKRIPMLPQDIETVDYRLVNRKPIIASEEEVEENNRSHPQKLE